MKKTEGMKLFLLKTLGVYRAVCLPVICIILLYTEEIELGGGGPPVVAAAVSSPLLLPFFWLLFSAVLFFCLLPHTTNLLPLLFADYTVVLLYSYFDHKFLIVEFIWIPGILLALALALPAVINKILPLLLGIPGALMLSWGYTSNLTVLVLGTPLPFYLAALLLYVPVSLLSLAAAFICSELEKTKKKNAGLELINIHLKELNRGVSEKIFRLQNDAAAETRKRLSKEIHDSTGYVFINLIMMLQAASAVFRKDTERAQKLVDDARDYAERGINEIRHQLRDIRSYTTSRISLQNEFFNMVESFHKATEVAITIEYGEWPPAFSRDIDAFFISFLQETLTNALKHGHASAISVLCWKSDSHIGMSVRDNGTGAAPPIKFGIGITAMEDVAGKLRGTITIRNGEPGFTISASIPLER